MRFQLGFIESAARRGCAICKILARNFEMRDKLEEYRDFRCQSRQWEEGFKLLFLYDTFKSSSDVLEGGGARGIRLFEGESSKG